MALTPKQARFVAEYLKDLNATQAAVRAGYSAKTARAQGSRLLTNADVCAAVAKGRERLGERAELSAALVLENLRRIAAKAEDAEQFAPAAKCNELLGKHLAMFTDKVEHSGRVSLEQLVVGSMKRPG